ncbi:hypothetical protein NWFMUON74_31790 [Nocardia wallacei]|uniref:Low molecular weight antigen MTB12-like C-terminal domain-containing protein n=1 Tax=Nocardia wallacei TaxID=480035 RepID=A0A7G1KJH5_9NOCA|nr:hypothetical protein NWFMUON74_31790 [Nocardia wallacei]
MLLPTGGTRCSGNVAHSVRVSRIRLVTATVFAALAVTGITACGSDTSDDSAAATSTTSAVAATSAASGSSAHEHGDAAAPTPEALQAVLDGFVDPAKPTADKAKLVVDGEKRTANIDTMTQGLANYGKITFAVSDVKTDDEDATAQVVITSPHGPAPAMPMTWEHSDAGWQLSDASACQILAMGKAPCQA